MSARSAIAVPLGAPHDIALRDSGGAEILTVDARYSTSVVLMAALDQQWPGAAGSLLCDLSQVPTPAWCTQRHLWLGFGVEISPAEAGFAVADLDEALAVAIEARARDFVRDGMGVKTIPGPGLQGGVHLMLKTARETIEIDLGPESFLKKQNYQLNKGDDITVVGSRVKRDAGEAVIARNHQGKGNDDLPRREGFPRWSGGAQF
jgi:hypothetical protein